jgi:bifunctional N-acetylglucosamine-1-phosphate-uridyltransferase/glucosamine-1-phosphate-acetyltransferase GlmU-like protein
MAVTRMLIIPAAGRGSRLGGHAPKALHPVDGRPMIDYLFARYTSIVGRIVVVLAPDGVKMFERYLAGTHYQVDYVVQHEPTGMLPAVLCARDIVAAHRPDSVWITWTDQIGISEHTAWQLADEIERHPEASFVFPTVRQIPPYVHYVRDHSGRISAVLRRRDGGQMPDVGESDAGLFAMSLETYLRDLDEYDRTLAPTTDSERNFLTFIPWLAERAVVHTFPLADAREAIGVNTPEDLRDIETLLRERA